MPRKMEFDARLILPRIADLMVAEAPPKIASAIRAALAKSPGRSDRNRNETATLIDNIRRKYHAGHIELENEARRRLQLGKKSIGDRVVDPEFLGIVNRAATAAAELSQQLKYALIYADDLATNASRRSISNQQNRIAYAEAAARQLRSCFKKYLKSSASNEFQVDRWSAPLPEDKSMRIVPVFDLDREPEAICPEDEIITGEPLEGRRSRRMRIFRTQFLRVVRRRTV